MASHVYKSNERFSMILGVFLRHSLTYSIQTQLLRKKEKIFFPRNGFSKHQSTSNSSYQRHVCKKRIVTTFDGLQNLFIYFLTLRAKYVFRLSWLAGTHYNFRYISYDFCLYLSKITPLLK